MSRTVTGRAAPELALVVMAVFAAGGCATTPHPVRTGDLVRVTTERDTVVGRMIVVRADTLFLERAERGFGALSVASIRSVQVDRASEKPWARPVHCLIAGTGLALTAYELAEYGADAEMIPIALVYVYGGWNCVDTRPHWRPAKIEGLEDDR